MSTSGVTPSAFAIASTNAAVRGGYRRSRRLISAGDTPTLRANVDRVRPSARRMRRRFRSRCSDDDETAASFATRQRPSSSRIDFRVITGKKNGAR